MSTPVKLLIVDPDSQLHRVIATGETAVDADGIPTNLIDNAPTTELTTTKVIQPDGLGGVVWNDLPVEGLTTQELGTGRVLQPDGAGGLVWTAFDPVIEGDLDLGCNDLLFVDTIYFCEEGSSSSSSAVDPTPTGVWIGPNRATHRGLVYHAPDGHEFESPVTLTGPLYAGDTVVMAGNNITFDNGSQLVMNTAGTVTIEGTDNSIYMVTTWGLDVDVDVDGTGSIGVYNNSAGSSAGSLIYAQTDGSGDAWLNVQTGAEDWSIGIDASDGLFKIHNSGSFGAGGLVQISGSTGVVAINTAVNIGAGGSLAEPALSISGNSLGFYNVSSTLGVSIADTAAGRFAATGFQAINGTNSDPSIAFSGDPDTGMYLAAEAQLGVATAGSLRATFADASLTLATNLLMGTNGIGRDDSVLTFATGGTGLATFGGGVATTHTSGLSASVNADSVPTLLTLANASTGSSAGTKLSITTAGADDPFISLTDNATTWIMGIDNSADSFKIDEASAFGSLGVFQISSTTLSVRDRISAFSATTSTSGDALYLVDGRPLTGSARGVTVNFTSLSAASGAPDYSAFSSRWTGSPTGTFGRVTGGLAVSGAELSAAFACEDFYQIRVESVPLLGAMTGNWFDLYLGGVSVAGGSIDGEVYGIYQASETASNYFGSELVCNARIGFVSSGSSSSGSSSSGDIITPLVDAYIDPTDDRLTYYAPNGHFFEGGSVSTDGTFLAPDGTQQAPSFSFADDANTGIYRVGTDTLGISAAGSPICYILQSGGNSQMQMIDGSVAAPAYSFISEPDTGISRSGVDGMVLVAGGSAVCYVIETAGNPQMRAVNGTAAAPVYTFNTDATSGLYMISAYNLGITTKGVLCVTISDTAITSTLPAQFVGITSTSTVTFPIDNQTTNYTVDDEDYTVTVDASGGDRTITLPTASGRTGRIYVIKRIDITVNIVMISAQAGEVIDANQDYFLDDQFDSITIQSDGSNWYIIAQVEGSLEPSSSDGA